MRQMIPTLPGKPGTALTGLRSVLMGGLRRMLTPAPGFVVGLIDMRTGDQHAVGNVPVVLDTTDPDAAIASLMRNRDPARYRPVILRNPAAEVPS